MWQKQQQMTRHVSLCVALLFFLVTVLPPETVFGLETSQIQKGAAQGDMNDAYLLGVMYRTGAGVAPDCFEALKWTRQAAMQGHALAQSHLGMLYKNGCNEKVVREPSEAYLWTALAAKQGLNFAKENLIELEALLHPYTIAEVNRKVEDFKPTKMNRAK